MRICRRLSHLIPALIVVAASVGAARADGPKRSFERDLKVTGPVEVSLEAASSDLKVVAGADGTVRIRFIVQSSHNGNHVPENFEALFSSVESNPPFKQEGNRIVLGNSADDTAPKGASVDYELTVPATTRLNFESQSGDLWAEGIRGPVSVETQSGDIRLNSVAGAIQIQTTSGDIKLQQTETQGIKIETTSGDVNLQLPEKASFDLSVRTASGDINVSPTFAGSARFDDEHAASLKVHGGGVPVEVRTASGDVTIQPATHTDHVAAN